MKKRIISLIMIFVLVYAQLNIVAVYQPEAYAEETIAENICGDGLIWSYDSKNKILTIEGTGDMYNYSYPKNKAPWLELYRSDVKKIIVSEGVTSIGTDAFVYMYNLTDIKLPSTIKNIYEGFNSCNELVNIDIHEDAKPETLPKNWVYNAWFEALPEGPVYVNGYYLTYKGDTSAITLFEFDEGTRVIGTKAFAENKNITEVIFPESVEIINNYAFQNCTNLETATFGGNTSYIGINAFDGTAWKSNLPQDVIYIDRVLYLCNKALSDYETDYIIKEGTKSVAPYAFYKNKEIISVTFPLSTERIGERSFNECKVLEKVKCENCVNLKEIGAVAFASCYFLNDVSFKGCKNLEVLGSSLFKNNSRLNSLNIEGCNIKKLSDGCFGGCRFIEFEIPDTVEYIGLSTFQYTKISSGRIPASVKYISPQAFNSTSGFEKFEVDKNSEFFSNDKFGALFNKDKTYFYGLPKDTSVTYYEVPEGVTETSWYCFEGSGVKTVTLPSTLKVTGSDLFSESYVEKIDFGSGLEYLNYSLFVSCKSLKEVIIPSNITEIQGCCFFSCSTIEKIVIPRETVTIGKNAIYNCDNVTIYCYEGSTAQEYAISENIPYTLIDENLEDIVTVGLNLALEKAEKINRDIYSDESLAVLDAAVVAVDMEKEKLTQYQVDLWVKDINNAISLLQYKLADYSSVNELLKQAESVNRTLYTEESLEKLDTAVASVNFELDLFSQETVEGYAKEINSALRALEYLPADYKKVEQAIAESEKLDRILYSQATLAVLDQSISNVDYTLNITQQNIVDGFAERINSAISSLAYAVVVLNNEPNGIIVSATAKEIYPETVLTVDVLDSTEIERTDFAFGGHIKSLNYYDINLLLNAEKVQPEGTVTVKIRVPEGADPKKCRVYHVSDDPVDPLVRFASTLDGNFVVFETDHFSEFAVVEVESYLSGVSVTKLPEKLDYSIGDKIDLSGMEVTSVMSDGKSQVITEYDVSSVDTSSVGTKTVTVYYTQGDITKSASFEITVSADSVSANITSGGESVTEINKKVKWYRSYSKDAVTLACSISASGKYNVKWSSDNAKVTVDSNGKVSCKGFLFAQKATVTATVTDSAGNVIATDSVVIRFYKFSFQLSKIQALVNEVFDPRRFRSL